MNSSQIQRLINLVKRTGDRVVIVDSETDEIFTLMRLNDYEKMLDSSCGEPIEEYSEKEMMDKINRDIAYWKACQENEEDAEGECQCEHCCPDCQEKNDFVETDSEAMDIPEIADYQENEPTLEPIDKTLPVEEFMPAQKKENVSEEDKETLLLEPV